MITTANANSTTGSPELAQTVQSLRRLAVDALGRMYMPQRRLFPFRLRKGVDGGAIEGVSHRYTAIALIGLAGEPNENLSIALCGQSPHEPCSRLLEEVDHFEDLGEVALTAWAAGAIGHSDLTKAIESLKRLAPADGPYPTVELSWALSAMNAAGDAADTRLAEAIARRLLGSFNSETHLFPHWPDKASRRLMRGHVTCFADFVYPVQALSDYYRISGDTDALDAARRCARRICSLQGEAGQWWWHYDVRTGRIVERFPVYSVHQDSMAPMALAAVKQACGDDHRQSIDKGLKWLVHSPEISGSLLDPQRSVIWRKVARHEPGKLVRGLQAAASRVHPALRVAATNLAFPPGAVDYECRPYHMGWILYAWANTETSLLQEP